MFSAYPLDVVERAVPKITCSTDRPTLKLIRAACDELYAPIARQIERDRAAESHRKALPPPRKRTPEEQARIDADVTAFRAKLGAVPREGLLPPSADMPINAPVPFIRNDGKHWSRIATDLEVRAARRRQSAVICGND